MELPEYTNPRSNSMNQVFDRMNHISVWTRIKIVTDKYISPLASSDQGLKYWQEWILQTLLVLALALGTVMAIPIFVISIQQGLWFLGLIYTVALLVTSIFVFARRLSYTSRVISVLILCYSLGTGLLIILGLSGGGQYWLFTFAILAAVFLDLKASVIALTINTVTLILASWLFNINYMSNHSAVYLPPFQVVISCINFLFLNVITTISTSLLVRSINSAYVVERRAKMALDIERKNLMTAKESLAREIDIRDQTEAALRKRERQYRLLADNVSDHIWILDHEAFLFIYTSPSITQILGYSTSEVIGTSLWDYIHPESVERVKKKLLEELRKKEDSSGSERMRTIEFMKRRKDGTMVWVETQVSFIRDENGLPVSILGVSRDISRRKAAETKLIEAYAALDQRVWERTVELSEKNTELYQEIEKRKKAQEISERANKAKSDFLANMSHELRTPLNHIIGFTELVADKHFGPLNEVQEEYLNDVLSSGRHLLSLINDILDLSKVEAGKMVLNLSDVRLSTLLASSFTMIREKAIKHNIQLTSEIGKIPKKIRADERKLKQVMYNLLSNAAKFTPDNGKIHVTANGISLQNGSLTASSGKEISLPESESKREGTPREFVEIMVSDTGIGLSEEDLTLVFAPFEQVESDANRKYEGTGLGLPLSRHLITMHDGWIWAESDGPEKGCRFYVVIPVDGPDESPSAQLIQEQKNSGGI